MIANLSHVHSSINRKLIGARYYLKGYEQHYGPLNTTLDSKSPRDLDGHGTHTTSTVGGRSIPNVSALGGYGLGTISGGAPLARLAIYKVCWAIPGQSKVDGNTCFEEDMLAAFDDAIADGVHILSVSIGTHSPIPYKQDGIAVGAFHAAKNNIVVACAAGNSGPTPSTLSNPAPWIITVGASSLDRRFISPVILGNGERIEVIKLITFESCLCICQSVILNGSKLTFMRFYEVEVIVLSSLHAKSIRSGSLRMHLGGHRFLALY